MKRCPECGYRVKEDLRDCPLCGVRMLRDPGGNTIKLQTHVHTGEREQCLLPNRTEAEAQKARRTAVHSPLVRQRRNAGNTKGPGKLAAVIVVILLSVLIRACESGALR